MNLSKLLDPLFWRGWRETIGIGPFIKIPREKEDRPGILIEGVVENLGYDYAGKVDYAPRGGIIYAEGIFNPHFRVTLRVDGEKRPITWTTGGFGGLYDYLIVDTAFTILVSQADFSSLKVSWTLRNIFSTMKRERNNPKISPGQRTWRVLPMRGCDHTNNNQLPRFVITRDKSDIEEAKVRRMKGA